MEIATHNRIDHRLCGEPELLEPGFCRVAFTAREEMAADDSGLVHGGFIFGLADYAAMLAVNHPNVVLGGAESRFLKPVRVGEKLRAEARVTAEAGKKRVVDARVLRGEDAVFEGTLTCFVLERHVLDTG